MNNALQLVVLSYALVEEGGGPSAAVAGFATELAASGVDVTILALSGAEGHWLLKESQPGLRVLRIPYVDHLSGARALVMAVRRLRLDRSRPVLLWVSGIWGPQSLAAWFLSRRAGWPYVIRPEGALGRAALKYRRLKKLAYYTLVESRVLEHARAIHCMSEIEVAELPARLRSRAFVAPAGIECQGVRRTIRESPAIVGVLARIHPIKNHMAVLDAVESLVRDGFDLSIEFAGAIEDKAYARCLQERADTSAWLRGRLRFLGHVRTSEVPAVVQRWRLSMLLSEQENFGHAVITVAAAGVPIVVSPNVGLCDQVARFEAGAVAAPAQAAEAAKQLLVGDPFEQSLRCSRLADAYSWRECGGRLLGRLQSEASVRAMPRSV